MDFAVITTWRRRLHFTKVYLHSGNLKTAAFALLGRQSSVALLGIRGLLCSHHTAREPQSSCPQQIRGQLLWVQCGHPLVTQ